MIYCTINHGDSFPNPSLLLYSLSLSTVNYQLILKPSGMYWNGVLLSGAPGRKRKQITVEKSRTGLSLKYGGKAGTVWAPGGMGRECGICAPEVSAVPM